MQVITMGILTRKRRRWGFEGFYPFLLFSECSTAKEHVKAFLAIPMCKRIKTSASLNFTGHEGSSFVDKLSQEKEYST